MTIADKQNRSAIWIARAAIAIVFILNVQCAIAFLAFPERYIGAYGLSGTAGVVALQGIAVAFLMWNATYPVAIANPVKYRIVYIIVLVQQAIGLIGESFIYLSLGDTQAILANSIMRFIIFDGAGLVLMLAAFLWLQHKSNRLPTLPG